MTWTGLAFWKRLSSSGSWRCFGPFSRGTAAHPPSYSCSCSHSNHRVLMPPGTDSQAASRGQGRVVTAAARGDGRRRLPRGRAGPTSSPRPRIASRACLTLLPELPRSPRVARSQRWPLGPTSWRPSGCDMPAPPSDSRKPAHCLGYLVTEVDSKVFF